MGIDENSKAIRHDSNFLTCRVSPPIMGFSRVTAAQGQGRLISVAIGGHMESRVRLSASRRRTFIGEAENVSRGRGHKIL